jgi:hypothetical protein
MSTHARFRRKQGAGVTPCRGGYDPECPILYEVDDMMGMTGIDTLEDVVGGEREGSLVGRIAVAMAEAGEVVVVIFVAIEMNPNFYWL